MCTNMFVWLLKILCQTFIAFDQNKIIYDKKKSIFKLKKKKFKLQICGMCTKSHIYISFTAIL